MIDDHHSSNMHSDQTNTASQLLRPQDDLGDNVQYNVRYEAVTGLSEVQQGCGNVSPRTYVHTHARVHSRTRTTAI